MATVVTRDLILGLKDIATKELLVPDTIPVWGGMTIFIKQLTRGEQDEYLKRQFGQTKMKQDAKAKQQEISSISVYGHDSWLCVHGMCDDKGANLFTEQDVSKLNQKSGEAIGWLAKQITSFSGMDEDAKVARGESSQEEVAKEEAKN